MPEIYDAVFVGGGHNTLAAALHLAAKGWTVALFEQAAVAGGAVKTGTYTLPAGTPRSRLVGCSRSKGASRISFKM